MIFNKNLYKIDGIGNNGLKMKNLKQNEQGFIPLLLFVLAVVIGAIVLMYLRVAHASK